MKRILSIQFLIFLMSAISFAQTEVYVHSITDRAIPNVQMTTDKSTDANGLVSINAGEQVQPSYSDDPNNGLDLRDLVLLRKHILGIQPFPNTSYWMIADQTGNQGISTLDLAMLQRTTLELTAPVSNWQFVEISNEEYLGFKSGDVDDSALLPGETLERTGDVFFWDQELDANQEAVIEVNLMNVSETITGLELHLDYDPNQMIFSEVLDIPMNDLSLVYNEPELGRIIIQMYMPNGNGLDLNVQNGLVKGIVELRFTPLMNTTADELFSVSEVRPSFILDDDCEKEILNIEVGSMLSSSDQIWFKQELKISPNPASQFIELNFELNALTDYKFALHTIDGKKVLESVNQKRIDISFLTNGNYSYVFSTKEGRSTGKLLILN